MNQHYVPKVYLKNFAVQKGSEYYVDVFDIDAKRTFNSNISNICAEKDLYTIEDNNLKRDKLIVEKFYSDQIEPLYKKSYDILTNNKISYISHQLRLEILFGIFQLYTRNPQILKLSLKVHTNNIEHIYEKAIANREKGITYGKIDFSFREWSKKQIIKQIEEKIKKEFKERHLIGTKEVIEFHQNSKLEVAVIKDDSNFITSDNPLTFQDITTKNSHPLLKSKEFTIPLNHKYALTILHDNAKKLNTIYRHYIPNGSVSMINSNIENQCSRFLIGSNAAFEGYFRMKKILEDTSVDLQMDALKKTLEKIPNTQEYHSAINLLKVFIDKYNEQGTLSNLEQFELHKLMRNMGINAKMERIK
jgi:hypothetical protein